MVWLLLGIVVLSVLIVLVGPLLKPAVATTSHQTDLKAYQDEIARLQKEFETTGDAKIEARKIDLQRQLLVLTQKKKTATPIPQSLVINILFAGFIFGAIGLYSTLGRPDLTKPDALDTPTRSAPQTLSQNTMGNNESAMSLEGLVAQLKNKLETTQKDDANGWMLYARSLMNLGRFEEAFEAYEKTLSLTDNNPDIMAELDRARAFAAQSQASEITSAPRGPTAQDVEAAASMSAEDRSAMIEGMVANLAARLKDNPKDPEGWARLLRARSVMGQTERLAEDMTRITEIYADDPATRSEIFLKAGVSP